jgi:hypothetical protein
VTEVQLLSNDRSVFQQDEQNCKKILYDEMSMVRSGEFSRKCMGSPLEQSLSLASSSYSSNKQSITEMPTRQNREDFNSNSELERSDVDVAIEQGN